MPAKKMRTLVDVLSEIDKLKKEAEALRSRERKSVIRQIQEAILNYEITMEEIQTPITEVEVRPKRRYRKKAAESQPTPKIVLPPGSALPPDLWKSKRMPKYADRYGNVWSGGGSRPRWLAGHLAKGRKLEDFRVIDGKVQ